jgi:hypothetical protein
MIFIVLQRKLILSVTPLWEAAMFWDMPSHLLHTGFFFGRISALKMEVIVSSETSVHIWTARLYIPDDDDIHTYLCKKLKLYLLLKIFHFYIYLIFCADSFILLLVIITK